MFTRNFVFSNTHDTPRYLSSATATQAERNKATEVYAHASLLYAEALLLLAPTTTTTSTTASMTTHGAEGDAAAGECAVVGSDPGANAAAALRAIDLAILRGGPAWAARARQVNMAASRALAASRGPLRASHADDDKQSKSLESEHGKGVCMCSCARLRHTLLCVCVRA
jgi:hypothetical protein